MPKITKLCLHLLKLCRKKTVASFSGHGVGLYTYINILDEDFGFHVAWLLLHKQSALYS